jgi:SAM-dependent methyltransferase
MARARGVAPSADFWEKLDPDFWELLNTLPPRDHVLVESYIALDPDDLEARWKRNPDVCLLDVGCGTGIAARVLRKAGYTFPIHGIDSSKESIARANQQNIADFTAEVCSVNDLPSIQRRFSAALCVMVLHHVTDLNAALRGVCRSLCPGAVFSLSDKMDLKNLDFSKNDPQSDDIFYEHNADPTHGDKHVMPHPSITPDENRKPNDFRDALEGEGFRVKAITKLNQDVAHVVATTRWNYGRDFFGAIHELKQATRRAMEKEEDKDFRTSAEIILSAEQGAATLMTTFLRDSLGVIGGALHVYDPVAKMFKDFSESQDKQPTVFLPELPELPELKVSEACKASKTDREGPWAHLFAHMGENTGLAWCKEFSRFFDRESNPASKDLPAYLESVVPERVKSDWNPHTRDVLYCSSGEVLFFVYAFLTSKGVIVKDVWTQLGLGGAVDSSMAIASLCEFACWLSHSLKVNEGHFSEEVRAELGQLKGDDLLGRLDEQLQKLIIDFLTCYSEDSAHSDDKLQCLARFPINPMYCKIQANGGALQYIEVPACDSRRFRIRETRKDRSVINTSVVAYWSFTQRPFWDVYRRVAGLPNSEHTWPTSLGEALKELEKHADGTVGEAQSHLKGRLPTVWFKDVLEKLRAFAEVSARPIIDSVFYSGTYHQGEQLGSTSTQNAFGHEIKHVIGSLADAWLCDITDFFDPKGSPAQGGSIGCLYETNEDLNKKYAVVPERELFESALKYLTTWTFANQPTDLPFCDSSTKPPEDFIDLVGKCYKTAKDMLLVHALRKLDLSPTAKVKIDGNEVPTMVIVEKTRKVLDEICAAPNTDNICSDFPKLVWEGAQDQPLWLARLLISLFKEYLRHGDTEQAATVKLVRLEGGRYEFEMANLIPSESPGTEPWRARLRAAFTAAADSTRKYALERIWSGYEGVSKGSRGKDIRTLIAKQIDKNPEVKEGKRDTVIPAGGAWPFERAPRNKPEEYYWTFKFCAVGSNPNDGVQENA